MTAIAALGLTKRYRDGTLAVDGLGFEVADGQVCGLLGPNGAGKTTTVRMALGLIHPNAGEVAVLGERMRPGHPVLRRVGALVERPSFVPHISGMRNLRAFWRAGGGRWPPPGLDDALDLAGLGPAIDRKVKAYSQGMRQRLGIAQTLLGHPELLVLDEPTNGLDPGEIRAVRRFLAELSTTGTTVLVSSHLLAEVEQVCTHVVVMDRGRLVSTGTVADLIGTTGSVYVEVDDRERARVVLAAVPGVQDVALEGPGLVIGWGGDSRRPLVDALVAAGIGIETVTPRHRLEDAFLGLVGDREVVR